MIQTDQPGSFEIEIFPPNGPSEKYVAVNGYSTMEDNGEIVLNFSTAREHYETTLPFKCKYLGKKTDGDRAHSR